MGIEKGPTSADEPAAIVRPLGVVQNPDGSHDIAYQIAANDEVAYDDAVTDISELTGDTYIGKVEDYKQKPGARAFGFSSKRWNSPYNPRGPKPNWAPANTDPKDN